MKRHILVLFLLVSFVSGCASTGVGSKEWYRVRLAEIEESYKAGEITKAEYLQLKNEADRIRAIRYYDTDFNIGAGYTY